MKFLRPLPDMLLPTVVCVKSSLQYDPMRPPQYWYDQNQAVGNFVYYLRLQVNDQGSVELALQPVMTGLQARSANVPPDGVKNDMAELLPPVRADLDVSKIGYDPMSSAAHWVLPVPVDSNSLAQTLARIESKIDNIAGFLSPKG